MNKGHRLKRQGRGPAHVLYIIDQLCGIGGGERMLLNTLKLLPAERFCPSVVTFKIDPSLEVFRQFPCPLYVFPLQKTYDWNAFRIAQKIRQLIKSENVAIAHTFFETSDLWGGLLAKLSGCPIVISSRRDMGILRSRKHDLAYRLLRSQFDLILTVSEAVRDFTIRRDRAAPDRVRTVYNGLELHNGSDRRSNGISRSTLGISKTAPIIVTVAHIRKVKGMDVMLRSAVAVCEAVPSTVFLIVGRVLEMECFQELQGMVRTLGLEKNVRFLGTVENVCPLLQECNIFCLPSRSEGFSNALIEAMACGLPCVATDAGGNVEAVEEGRNGFIVPTEDPATLADRLLKLLTEPALAAKMGAAGRDIAQARFGSQRMIERLTAIYGELLAARGN
jgi:glycosyltransferase involved in cell wall biosynthesis